MNRLFQAQYLTYEHYIGTINTHMFIPRFTITPKITRDLEAIGAVFGYFRAVQLPENYKKELVSKVIAETVHASTAIEGNTLTENQVTDILSGKKVTAQAEDIKEVQNYNQALEFVSQIVKEEDFQLSDEFLKKVQAMVVKYIRDDIAGIYRTLQVHVGDYLPPQPYQIPNLMKELVSWVRNPEPQDLSPILYAGIAHYQLVAIHPFEDGNGRTTRLLTTLILVQNGYDMIKFFALESYYNRDRKAYYEALNSADKYRIEGQPDLTRWLEYYVEGMLIEAERARSRIEEMLEKSKSISGKVWLSDVQLKMLQLTKELQAAKTVDYLQVSGLKRKATYNALQKLVDLGLLKREGENKGAYYTITEEGFEYVR